MRISFATLFAVHSVVLVRRVRIARGPPPLELHPVNRERPAGLSICRVVDSSRRRAKVFFLVLHELHGFGDVARSDGLIREFINIELRNEDEKLWCDWPWILPLHRRRGGGVHWFSLRLYRQHSVMVEFYHLKHDQGRYVAQCVRDV